MALNKNISIEMASCFTNPQAGLVEAIETNNLELFKNLLESGADADLIDDDSGLSPFNIATLTPGRSTFIKVCVQHGCRPDMQNEELLKSPINFAAQSVDVDNLAAILQYPSINVNAQYENLTALHQLVRSLDDKNFDQTFDCIKLLVKHEINVNIHDRKNVTPILTLTRSKVGQRAGEIIQYLIDKTDVDLDSFRDGEARKEIEKNFPHIRIGETKEVDRPIDFNSLLSLLNEEKEPEFLAKLELYKQKNFNHHNILFVNDGNNDSLLHIAVRKGLFDAVQAIVECGGDPNLKLNKFSPLGLACVYGHHKILKYFLEHLSTLENVNPDPLLIIVSKKLGEDSVNPKCDYSKCYDHLIADERIDLNEIDMAGCTALHYAVRNKDEKAIRELLDRGSYIGLKDKYRQYPISEISPRVLENFFDSCIQTNSKRISDDDFQIIFDYKSLEPAKARPKLIGNGVKDVAQVLNQHVEEMSPIECMLKTPELRHLVKHPLISSFMWLKWYRLSTIFYTNFLLYSLFCISLILYIVFFYGVNKSDDLSALLYVISLLGIIYVFLREVAQLLIMSYKYLQHFENYVEIALIVLTMVILSGCEMEDHNRRMISAITILLAALEFTILVGSLPIMSISTHMVMLRTVSISFMRSLVLYSIIIISFALCFFTLLSTGDQKKDGETVADDDDDQFNRFADPGTSLIKTIVMFTGEFDAASIKFENNQITYVVFVLFVFFISIVLLNLLNGLAVNDTHEIKAEAELTGLISRAELLIRYEEMMLGRTISFDCGNSIIRNWLLRIRSFRIIMLFNEFLPMHRMVLKPNEHNAIYVVRPHLTTPELTEVQSDCEYTALYKKSPTDNVRLEPSLSCCCFLKERCSRLDGKIVKYAFAVLERKEEKIEMDREKEEMNNKMLSIESSLGKLESLLTSVDGELRMLKQQQQTS